MPAGARGSGSPGTIRITTGQHAAERILWPALLRLLPQYPDVKVELSIDQALTDIVSERFDAGVRLGEQVAKDMIAVRIGPDLRLPTLGGLYAWEFEKGGRELNARVDGRLVFNDVALVLKAATAGFGLACVMEDQVQKLIGDGALVRVLADWCPPFPGYHLYYASRHQPTPAFGLLVETLRHREGRSVAARARP